MTLYREFKVIYTWPPRRDAKGLAAGLTHARNLQASMHHKGLEDYTVEFVRQWEEHPVPVVGSHWITNKQIGARPGECVVLDVVDDQVFYRWRGTRDIDTDMWDADVLSVSQFRAWWEPAASALNVPLT